MRQYIDAVIKEMYLFGMRFLFIKNPLVFGPYRPEKEKCYFNKFKFKIDLDRHCPRPLLNERHLAELPPFSVYLNTSMISILPNSVESAGRQADEEV